MAGSVSQKSLKQWEKLVDDYHNSFSNSKVRILNQIAEANFVATRWEFTATQTGEYMGLAPTNKRVTWTGVEIDRFAQDKIAESWVDWDKYRLFHELGLIKSN
ncbi:MAG: ester cyclase [Desulfobacteraceae bacterium]|nr:ester cyclase [Desulfobacteraceae bacterium]